MDLLLRFLPVFLLFEFYGSLAEEDILASFDSGLSSSLPFEIAEGGTQLSLGLEPIPSGLEDLFLPSNGVDLGSDLFKSESAANFPLDDLSSSNEGFEIDLETNSGLLASAGASCVSDGGQFLGRTRRRDKSRCDNLNLKEPPTDDHRDQPTNPNEVFPRPGFNGGRLPGSFNDPQERPPGQFPALNTDFDNEYCPSGINGFRQYAICDSGLDRDRFLTGRFVYTLYHVSRCKFCSSKRSSPLDDLIHHRR